MDAKASMSWALDRAEPEDYKKESASGGMEMVRLHIRPTVLKTENGVAGVTF